MNLKGRVWKFGDDVNTDEIIPARYLNTANPAELAKHCMEDADPEFVKKITKGDIIVAGNNFGCGSSREHAPISIKAVNISCVIASSFARIFYRNCVNIGLPIIESFEASCGIHEGDIIEVNFENGEVTNCNSGKIFKIKPYPPFMKDIIERGGLMNKVRSELKDQ